jgi:hypothetical protein
VLKTRRNNVAFFLCAKFVWLDGLVSGDSGIGKLLILSDIHGNWPVLHAVLVPMTE